MIFLVQYERRTAKLVRLNCFADDQRVAAEKARLDLELTLLDCEIEQEIVLLEAESELALRRTHGRYFQTLAEIVAAGETEATPA